jgi:transmembrane sensor
MNQHDFDLLLQRYLEGHCSEEEEKQILKWSEYMLRSTPLVISTTEKNLVRKRIWKRLLKTSKRAPFFPMVWAKARIAASIFMLLAAGLIYWYAIQKTPAAVSTMEVGADMSTGNIEVKNTSEKSYKMILEDGSQITLKPQSSISYPEHFDEETRKVRLHGEAFFDVKKDSARPFYVYTGGLVTRVLGTSFNVKAYRLDKAVEVSVVTGRVSVYESSRKTPQTRNGIILIPNQKIRFDKEVKVLVPELVEEPVVVHPPEQKAVFVFSETPLAEVLAMIQHVYEIEIVIETAALENCVFTGDINDLPLYSQLKLICKSVNANYELRGTTLFINGDGCRH